MVLGGVVGVKEGGRMRGVGLERQSFRAEEFGFSFWFLGSTFQVLGTRV